MLALALPNPQTHCFLSRPHSAPRAREGCPLVYPSLLYQVLLDEFGEIEGKLKGMRLVNKTRYFFHLGIR